MSGLRVALDGPGSSGKSSVGAAAAARLGYRFLDTGVLYRAITLLSVLREIEPHRWTRPGGGRARARAGHGRGWPDASCHHRRRRRHRPAACARRRSPRQRRVGPARRARRAARYPAGHRRAGAIILAGRDIGTVVLPDADLKLYLEVSVEERARRRASRARTGSPTPRQAATILADLRRRDHLDGSRAVAPLRVPDDAVIVRSDEHDLRRHRGQGRGHRPRTRRAGDHRRMNDHQAMTLYPRFIAGLCRFGLQAIGRVRVEGLEDLPQHGPLIIAANHMSNADPPFIGGWLEPGPGTPPHVPGQGLAVQWPAGHPHPLARCQAGQGRRQRHRRLSRGQGHPRRRRRGGHPAGGYAFVRWRPGPGPSRACRCSRRAPARLSCLSASAVPMSSSAANRCCPGSAPASSCAWDDPSRLTLPGGVDRRAALAAADVELMRRIATLVEPRHRGEWEPWPAD